MIQKSMPQSTCFQTGGSPVNQPRTARAMARNPHGHFQVFWLKRHRLIRLPGTNAPVASDIRLFYIQQRHCTGFSPVSLSIVYFCGQRTSRPCSHGYPATAVRDSAPLVYYTRSGGKSQLLSQHLRQAFVSSGRSGKPGTIKPRVCQNSTGLRGLPKHGGRPPVTFCSVTGKPVRHTALFRP